MWHTGDRVAPSLVDACLARYGFEATEELDILAFELGDGPEPVLPRLGVPEDVSAELVRDPGALREALLLDSEVFSSPPPSGEEFGEYAVELERLRRRERGKSLGGETSLALRFAAFVDADSERGGDSGRIVVAAAGAQVVNETLRLWGAATSETYRGRGAYRALVLERCRVGSELGASLALTKANVVTSSPILGSAGFRRVGSERRHVLEVRP